MNRLLARLPDDTLRTTIFLSPREQEVLLLVADDRSNKEIAEQLGLAEGTIKTFVSTLLSGLGIRSRTGLCSFAFWHPSAVLTGSTAILESGKSCRCPVCSVPSVNSGERAA